MTKICNRCRCCSMEWEDCWNCDEDGFVDHDCGEDTCCCLEPENNVSCDICRGKAGYWLCGGRCDEDGKHAVVDTGKGIRA